MVRYVPKTVREYGRIHLAERLAEHGWECFIARRSPNEDEVIAGSRSRAWKCGSSSTRRRPARRPVLQRRHAGLGLGVPGDHHVRS